MLMKIMVRNLYCSSRGFRASINRDAWWMLSTPHQRLSFLNFCHLVFYIWATETQYAAIQTALYQAEAARVICWSKRQVEFKKKMKNRSSKIFQTSFDIGNNYKGNTLHDLGIMIKMKWMKCLLRILR